MSFNQRKWVFILLIGGCIQFIVITFTAMFFYKGGTYIDPSTSFYVFWNNYFSDLGRTIAHSGISNTISFILFTISLSIWGVSQIPFYITLISLFKKEKGLKSYSILGSLFGFLTGIFYTGIAFTPSDILNLPHDIFVFLGFGSIFLSLILYSIAISRDSSYPNLYAKISVISALILGTYFIILSLVPSSLTPLGLFIYVVGQKIMIYTLLINGIIQGFGALKQWKALNSEYNNF
ncbi:MAG: hypothetical protein ACXAAI_04690 [Promethearchaeota archaeon]